MTVTVTLLVILTIFLALYDVWAVIHGGIEATISWTIWSASIRWPIIPFAFGLLMGHFFWPI